MSHHLDSPNGTFTQTKREMFIKVYDEFRSTIFNYIFYRIGDLDLADDLTSDVFVRLVEKYDNNFRKDQPIAPWLYAIARNLVIDHHRRVGRIGWQPLSEKAAATEMSNPAKLTEKQITKESLIVALENLTEGQKQVILLKFIERRTNQEVGDILGKPEGAIKSLQHRALAALRRALEKEFSYEA